MKNIQRLKRTKQCAHCPWKVTTNPLDIPNGYCRTKHRALETTISNGSFNANALSELTAMACHESSIGEEEYCVGWLHNQLGAGNNIALRLSLLGCPDLKDLEVFGEQHERFEDTLPG